MLEGLGELLGAFIEAMGEGGLEALLRRRGRGAVRFSEAPLTLSLLTANGLVTPWIERGSILPAKRIEKFHTATASQDEIELTFYVGMSELSKRCKAIGSATIMGCSASYANRAEVLVETILGTDGFTNVRAWIGDNELKVIHHFKRPDRYFGPDTIEPMYHKARKHPEKDCAEIERRKSELPQALDLFPSPIS